MGRIKTVRIERTYVFGGVPVTRRPDENGNVHLRRNMRFLRAVLDSPAITAEDRWTGKNVEVDSSLLKGVRSVFEATLYPATGRLALRVKRYIGSPFILTATTKHVAADLPMDEQAVVEGLTEQWNGHTYELGRAIVPTTTELIDGYVKGTKWIDAKCVERPMYQMPHLTTPTVDEYMRIGWAIGTEDAAPITEGPVPFDGFYWVGDGGTIREAMCRRLMEAYEDQAARACGTPGARSTTLVLYFNGARIARCTYGFLTVEATEELTTAERRRRNPSPALAAALAEIKAAYENESDEETSYTL